jgi:hypothetical protein
MKEADHADESYRDAGGLRTLRRVFWVIVSRLIAKMRIQRRFS